MTTGQMQGNPDAYRCPACNAKADGFTSREREAYPSPGALGVCGSCDALLEYIVDGLKLAPAGLEATLPEETKRQLEQARELSRRVKARKADSFPPAYYLDIETMVETAKAWIAAHPVACLVLEPINPDKMPHLNAAQRHQLRKLIESVPAGEKIAFIVDLTSALEWWGGNEATRDMLRAMDQAIDQRGSYTMAQVALEIAFSPTGTIEAQS